MPIVVLSHVSVRFPLLGSRCPSGTAPSSRLGGLIGRARRGPSFVDALNDVSLSLRAGDRLGIIGHNGSGKSTLLRVIGSIYEPWRGTVEVSGRVLSLADPMLGMNHECTGRENVVLRGIFMGLKPRQVLASLDEIADFSELGAYMDLPFKTYSVGMQLRLAFSIATAFDPEILLLDEQLAMGDAAFIERAERRLKGFVAKAGILVRASHSEESIRSVCSKVMLLEHGRVVAMGSPDDVFARYRAIESERAARAA